MARNLLAAFAALALLATGSGARALPATDLGDLTGGGVFEPPVDPCVQFPDLCPPEPPEPPTSICDRLPDLCVNGDPQVLEPTDPTPPSFDFFLVGTARVKGQGLRTTALYGLRMNVDTTALTFLAMDEHGTLYSGHLVPKGTKGDKFRVFLDDVSTKAFGLDVAGRAADAAGSAAGSVLGQSSKLVLTLGDEGTHTLKIQSQVLSSALGELAFKATLTQQQL